MQMRMSGGSLSGSSTLAKGEELLAELDVSGPDEELFAAEIDERTTLRVRGSR